MMPALLSTAYLPPVFYFALLTQSEKSFIDIHETYQKQTYRNRCHIYSSNGLMALTIPIKKVNGNHTKTKDILVDNSVSWQRTHWKAIESAYSKSPFFLYYRDDFSAVYRAPVIFLQDWNSSLLQLTCNILKIAHRIPEITSEYIGEASKYNDWRKKLSPKNKMEINGQINFPRYIQTFEERYGFIPNLSIVDLLFNHGPVSLPYMAGIFIEPKLLT